MRMECSAWHLFLDSSDHFTQPLENVGQQERLSSLLPSRMKISFT